MYTRISDYLPPRNCKGCRYYKDGVVVHDRFWGDIKKPSYCVKKHESVIPTKAPECKLFLEKTFRSEQND